MSKKLTLMMMEAQVYRQHANRSSRTKGDQCSNSMSQSISAEVEVQRESEEKQKEEATLDDVYISIYELLIYRAKPNIILHHATDCLCFVSIFK